MAGTSPTVDLSVHESIHPEDVLRMFEGKQLTRPVAQSSD